MEQQTKRGRGQPRKPDKTQFQVRAYKTTAERFANASERLGIKQTDAFEQALQMWLKSNEQ